MATKTSRVPKEDWTKHKATILELYCEKGLPLTQGKNTQDARRCVDWIMKHEHGFSASVSQYEAQLRRWGATKNLKQSEWVSLLSEYSRLEHQGKDVRIVIFGQVQTREKINKARHRYMKRTQGALSAASLAQPVASNRHSFVQVKEGGQWTQYRDDNTPENGGSFASGSNAPQGGDESHEEAASIPGTRDFSPQRQSTPHRELAMLSQSVQWRITPEDIASWEFGLTCQSMSGFTINTFGISPGLQMDRPSLNNELMLFDFNIDGQSTIPRNVETGMQDGDDSPSASTYYSHSNNGDDLNASHSSLDASMETQMSFNLVLRSKFAAALARNPTGSFDVRGAADRFVSLLSDASIFWHHRNSAILVQSSSEPDHALFNTLLYSIINGFAGLEELPHRSVLELLRENRMFYSHMSRLLSTGPDSVAKPIVDNLFPAAIQAGDVEAVTWFLQATANHPSISIDLNESVFHVPAGIFTPLALAVRSGSTEVVRVILEAGADPNREIDVHGHRDLLSLVLSLRNSEVDYPGLEVVRLLLDHGAEINLRSIDNAVHDFARCHLILEELGQRLPASQHSICLFFSELKPRPVRNSKGDMRISINYTNQGLAEDMVQFADNSVATSLVKKVVEDCMSTNCRNCIQSNPGIVSSMLLHAARRGNLELVTFLARYTTSLHQALAGAVKSSNCDLIAFLQESGARADGPPVFVFADSLYNREPSTPLAEAIRQGDEELVHSLADYGAWRRLDDRDHLEAALYAAAEVGDVRYLAAVLCRIAPSRRPLYIALVKAIASGSTECALALLKAGAPTHSDLPSEPPSKHDALSLALQMRNKDVAYAILDCGVLFCNNPSGGALAGPVTDDVRCTMELAGAWGDTEIIDAIASMGADLDAGLHTTALAAAVASRNRQLVDHILDLGADPEAKALIGRSPLGEAVNNKDHSMIDYLLSRGATPADTSAFLAAMECDQAALTKLCSAFKQKYPFGLKEFGAELTAKAIRENNTTLLSCLLDLKIDLARLAPWHSFEASRTELEQRYPERMGRLNPLGFAILHLKGENLHLVELLLKSGAPVNAIAAEAGLSPEGRYVRSYTVSSVYPCTPLLLAVSTRRTGVIDLLLEAGADLNLPARRGILCTPLQEACKRGSYDLVEFLLQKGADVNSPAARRRGGTALQFAARGGSLKMVELLILNKADLHAPGSKFGEGGTAFELAAEYGRYHVLLLLWNIAPRDGFTAEILRSAQSRAGANGHRGCVDFIANIIQDVSFGRLISGVA